MPRVPITDSFPDMTGRIVEGRLLLTEVLGSGAYGKVYKALDKYSPSSKPIYYAVKCLLKPKSGSRQDDFQRREFALHQMVSVHPNIVTFHGIVEDSSFTYVVLDFCDGGDLFSAITEHQIFRQDTELIKSVFVQILDAVHFCHEQGVYHRDIKPENILCCKGGKEIRLADFGLSTDNKISHDFGCGSSFYMSPECIGKEFKHVRYSTRHSDIWSLGIILTNMISGRNPWRYAMTTDDCFSAFLHDRDFLRAVLPISESANYILKRIFNLNPLCRITIPELRDEILKLDTFFMSREELTLATPQCRTTAKHYAGRVPTEEVHVVVQEHAVPGKSPTSVEGPLSLDSEEVFLYARPSGGFSSGCSPDKLPDNLNVPVDSSSNNLSSVSATNSSGPITPVQYAVEPEVEVPSLPEGQGLGDGLIPRVIRFHASPGAKMSSKPISRAPSNSVDHPPLKRSQFFRRAMQKLKAIPGSSSP